MMKKLLIILFSIAFIISCNKNNDGMNVIPSKYVGVYSYGDGKRIIIKDDGKTVVNQNGESGTIEKISETEYKIKFGNTEITITFGNNNGATIKDENGKSHYSYKEEYIETDPNKGIEQFAGKYNSENNDGKYVTIKSDGSLVIGVNPTPDTFEEKEKIKLLSGSTYTFMAGTKFENIYTIEFLERNRLKLIYAAPDNPLYFVKE